MISKINISGSLTQSISEDLSEKMLNSKTQLKNVGFVNMWRATLDGTPQPESRKSQFSNGAL